MKLCFFPMLLYSCFMNRKLKDDYPCVTSSLLFGVLLGTFLIPIIFYTYSGILGQNYIFFDIATFIISVLLAFIAVYRLSLSCVLDSFLFWLATLVFLTAICFLVFTYYPPCIGLFAVPSGQGGTQTENLMISGTKIALSYATSFIIPLVHLEESMLLHLHQFRIQNTNSKS